MPKYRVTVDVTKTKTQIWEVEANNENEIWDDEVVVTNGKLLEDGPESEDLEINDTEEITGARGAYFMLVKVAKTGQKVVEVALEDGATANQACVAAGITNVRKMQVGGVAICGGTHLRDGDILVVT